MKPFAAPKAPAAKKKAAAPAATRDQAKAAPKAPVKATRKAQTEAKPSWAQTMKQALEKKQPAGGFPNQPKPRDSGIQKVKKNAF